MRGFYFITIFSFLLSSCNYKELKNATNAVAGKNPSFKANAVVGWDVMRDSVLTQCMSCHVGRTNPELGSYTSVVQNISKIESDVLQNVMPPAKNGYEPLNSCYKSILTTWIQAGTPETTTTKVIDLPDCHTVGNQPPQEETPIALEPLNYDVLLKRILRPRCLNCHNPDSNEANEEGEEARNLLFYPFSEIENNATKWGISSSKSKIIRHLESKDPKKVMPPPPKDLPLRDEEINYVKRWIDAGKPEF